MSDATLRLEKKSRSSASAVAALELTPSGLVASRLAVASASAAASRCGDSSCLFCAPRPSPTRTRWPRLKPLSHGSCITPLVAGGSRLGSMYWWPMPRRSHCASRGSGSLLILLRNSLSSITPEPSASSSLKTPAMSASLRSSPSPCKARVNSGSSS